MTGLTENRDPKKARGADASSQAEILEGVQGPEGPKGGDLPANQGTDRIEVERLKGHLCGVQHQ